jgi:DNA-binding response OmpR family regulator
MSEQIVMLIETDLLVRTPLAQYLRDCGFRVIEAFNTAEARGILAHAGISIDTILMDADTAEENGFVFRAWMREHHPSVTVILAGSLEKTTARAGELCEEGPALAKPYDHRLVLQAIRRSIAARGPAKS